MERLGRPPRLGGHLMGRRAVPLRVLETLENLRDQVREEILKDPRYVALISLERSIHDIRAALNGAGIPTARIAPPETDLAAIIDGRLAAHGHAAVGASGLAIGAEPAAPSAEFVVPSRPSAPA